ncbi:MAG: DegT/DnrJ/EryC1/StrS aminotransferase family protein [Pseudomonadota bacterium]
MNIPFIDLKAQQQQIAPQIDRAIKKVLDHGKYIMGPEIFEFEQDLEKFCNVKYAITCSSGTDALLMILMAKNITYGDCVFVPNFTFTATPEVIALLGATPIFVDVDAESFNIDIESLEQAIETAKIKKLNPKAIIAVDLFGQPANYQRLKQFAAQHDLWILADAAQSFGATLHHQKVGQMGLATATSFFPAKPLGCYGDGGAILTDDEELAECVRSIRIHGKGSHKYDNIRIGLNARMDTIQAAILIEKLKIFPCELIARQKVASFYENALTTIVKTPRLIEGATSSWAQYTIKIPSNFERHNIINDLKAQGIPTMVYYQKPLHLQTAYKNFPTAFGARLSVSETLCNQVLSLPMCPYLSNKTVGMITETLHQIIEKQKAIAK